MSKVGVENKPGCLLGLVRVLVKKEEEKVLTEVTDMEGVGFVRFAKGTLPGEDNKRVTSAYAFMARNEDGSRGWRLLPVIGRESSGELAYGTEPVKANNLGPVFRRDYKLERQRSRWGISDDQDYARPRG